MAVKSPQGFNNQRHRRLSSESSAKPPQAGRRRTGESPAAQGASLRLAREAWRRADRYRAPTGRCRLGLPFPDRRERFHSSRGFWPPTLLRACTLWAGGTPGCPPPADWGTRGQAALHASAAGGGTWGPAAEAGGSHQSETSCGTAAWARVPGGGGGGRRRPAHWGETGHQARQVQGTALQAGLGWAGTLLRSLGWQ